ncbi:MAG: hypothetical protein RIR79_1335 [Pseudomonadota bacterium]|jgi:DNA polymerase
MRSLHLDTRQRAMLQEMGIDVWLPVPVPVSPVPVRALAPKPLPKSPPVAVAVAKTEPQPDEPVRADFADAVLPNQQADWFIVGDLLPSPASGNPPAMVLLENMLKAVGISDTHYLSRAVEYRTSHSVTPSAQELEQCRQWVVREMAVVQPRILVAMGKFAIQLVLQDYPQQVDAPLDKQRGTVYSYQGIPVVISYNPRTLLRSGANKAKAWADWCLALDRMDTR